jgi:TolC family type I secretion outer membrane protein
MLTALVVVAVPASLQAQTVTLKEAAAIALNQNRQVAAQDHYAGAMQARADAARGHLLPSVNAGVGGMRSTNPLTVFGSRLSQQQVTTADFAPGRLNNPAAYTNYRTYVGVQMPVYMGGSLWAGKRQAEAAAVSADWQLEATRQQTLYQLIAAYTGVLEARELVRAREQAVKAATTHRRNVQQLLDRGMAIRSDAMDAEVHLMQAGVDLSQARNGEAAAMDRLHLLLGQSAAVEIDPSGDVRLQLQENDLKQWLDEALDRRPELKASAEQLRASDAGVDRARAGFLPHVALHANEEWNNNTLTPKHNNYTVGFQVEMNLFSGGADKANVDAAYAEKTRSQLMLEDMTQQVRNEVRQAWRMLEESRQRADALAHALDQAEESLRILTLRQQQGLERAADVLTAQARADQVRAGHIQAEYDVIRSQAALLRAAGMLNLEAIQ